MTEYWNLFWIFMAIIGFIGILALIFPRKIGKVMEKIDYYANGHTTHHHKYIPYD